jgi:hypothetical protein
MNIRVFPRKLYKSSSMSEITCRLLVVESIEGGVGCIEELSADEVDGADGGV